MNLCDIILSVVLMFLGVIIALWYENLGSPILKIFPHDTTEGNYKIGTVKFIHLKVKNDPRSILFVPKQTAYACHGDIEFLTDKHEPTNISVQFKWDGTPEPVKAEILGEKVVYLPDNRLIRTTRFIDIAPGEEETLAIAFRNKDDVNAYGWSYLNYQTPDWRYPGCALPTGNFIARITIKSGDIVVKEDFPFANPENFNDFDLLNK